MSKLLTPADLEALPDLDDLSVYIVVGGGEGHGKTRFLMWLLHQIETSGVFNLKEKEDIIDWEKKDYEGVHLKVEVY